jgi:hypothetical protein
MEFCLQSGTSNILLAASRNQRAKSLRDPKMLHEMRFTQLLPERQEKAIEESFQNYPTMDIRVNGATIPPQTTTYWCAIVELEEQMKRRKHHAIKVNIKNIN